MAFDLTRFTPLGGQSAFPKATRLWGYNHPSDSQGTIAASAYFNSVAKMLQGGDMIAVSANGAAVTIYTVNAVTPNVTMQSAKIASA